MLRRERQSLLWPGLGLERQSLLWPGLGLERQSLLWQRIRQGFALMSKQALTLQPWVHA